MPQAALFAETLSVSDSLFDPHELELLALSGPLMQMSVFMCLRISPLQSDWSDAEAFKMPSGASEAASDEPKPGRASLRDADIASDYWSAARQALVGFPWVRSHFKPRS